jgi:CHASE3 domain sensor protein/anti-sigma regulatory factor (Ser/Thr protein kinase)
MIRATSLRTRTLLASGALALAVAAVIGLLLMTVIDLRDTSDRARHSEVVLAQAATLEKLLLDMESGARGYVITRSEPFLAPYEQARRALPAATARLELLVADNPVQRARARAIGTAIRSWLHDYASPLVALARRGGPARKVVAAGEGMRRVDTIRRQFQAFAAEEVRLARIRRDTAGDAATRAGVAGVAGLVVLIALVALLTRFLFRAFGREEQAASAARLAQSRVSVLARASEELSASLDYEKTLAEVARIAVPTVADWCSVELVEEDGTLRSVAVAHVDPEKVALALELQQRYPSDPDAPTGSANVVRTGESELYPNIPDELLAQTIGDPEQLELIRELGLCSAMSVPLTARGRTLGTLTLIAAESQRSFTAGDLPFAEDLGRRAALAIDNARLYAQERRIAETLQRSLLPESLPTVHRTAVGARYVPAEDEAEVGGDWYDVIPLPGGKLGLVIGDVVGHGVRAAAVMGQLRSAVRAYAVEGHPADATIERVKTMLHASGPASMIGTLLVITYDPASRTIAYSSAGHPPPLVRDPGGAVRFLHGAVAPPLGVDRRAAPAVEVVLEPNATVLLYTDGLVERRNESLTHGFQRLEQAVESAPQPIEELLDHVLQALGADSAAGDDVALLALTALGPRGGGGGLDFELPAERDSVRVARRALVGWLDEIGASESERYELSVAVSDACANAIEHAYGPEDAMFAVRAKLSEDEVVIEVSDSGSWRAQRGTNRGRGLLLMDAYTDSLEIDRGAAGTTVRMRRRMVTEERAA